MLFQLHLLPITIMSKEKNKNHAQWQFIVFRALGLDDLDHLCA